MICTSLELFKITAIQKIAMRLQKNHESQSAPALGKKVAPGFRGEEIEAEVDEFLQGLFL